MKTLLLLFVAVALVGCAGGPTHDYYNPAVVDAKFKPPITMALVPDVEIESAKLVADGYKVIGTTGYTGKYPEAVELKAQARRVGANRVIYSARYIPPAPGSWSFGFNRLGGAGGSDGGSSDVHIIFLGK